MSKRPPDDAQRITSAPEALAADQARRARRYLIQMGIRVVCFLLAVLLWRRVPLGVSLLLIVGAVVLPYVAVLFANAGRERRDEAPPGVLPRMLDAAPPAPPLAPPPARPTPATSPPTEDPDDHPDARRVGDDLVCSARGCRADARWGVLWNNPKLHAPERRKVWLACDDHREHLEEYLRARVFFRDTVPVADLPRVDLGARPGFPGSAGLPVPGAGAAPFDVLGIRDPGPPS